MTVFQAFVLGLVQGMAEFLPISSSGFLILVPKLFGWQVQSLAFDAFLHIATLTATITALWPEVKMMLKTLFLSKKEDQTSHEWRSLALWIVCALIPVALLGSLFQNFIENNIRSERVVALSLIIWGIVLYIADKRTVQRTGSVTNVGLKRAFLIGCAQVIALIPGTSRSGITITAGLFSGLSRETAARFSFLLAIPTVAAAGFFKLWDVIDGGSFIELAPLLVGFFTAAVSGFLTVRFLLQFLKRSTFSEFAIFRILIGVFILLFI
ncbi:TPA: undecaprenyl-diphosphatase UppP [Candidatus Uhrbacteria bacterium]|nr:undecaprenyl-diphosphatase UppP [Candidatus Uhrbacteria bacterium]